MELQRIVNIEPAYDKRNKDPKKNYGIHGVNLRFLLKGDKGAVQFLLFTNWHLPHVKDELLHKVDYKGASYVSALFTPSPADLGYHSLKPMYEGQEQIQESCEYLDGAPCYYDGSGLNADRIYKVMVAEGGEAMWKELEDYYRQCFEEVQE